MSDTRCARSSREKPCKEPMAYEVRWSCGCVRRFCKEHAAQLREDMQRLMVRCGKHQEDIEMSKMQTYVPAGAVQ